MWHVSSQKSFKFLALFVMIHKLLIFSKQHVALQIIQISLCSNGDWKAVASEMCYIYDWSLSNGGLSLNTVFEIWQFSDSFNIFQSSALESK